MQKCGMASPFVSLAQSLNTQTDEDFVLFLGFTCFRPKAGLNLSEDLFFWSSPTFAPKTGLNLSRKTFVLVLSSLKFSAPPPFENLAYATAYSTVLLR